MPSVRLIVVVLLLPWLAACGMLRQPERAAMLEPVLLHDHALMDDGYQLPLDAWRPRTEPRAVLLALHGFNDYRKAFDKAGPYLAERGIVTYAYDQRGFGETAYRGLWAGTERLAADLHAMVRLLRQRYPGLPLYLLGESMGGALSITALGGAPAPEVDGVVLVAPAVWSRLTMPWYQRWALWLAARVAPGWKPTGESLNLWPTDNIELLRAMARDPLVIKATRIDTIVGLVDLMDAAMGASPRLAVRGLVLYGAKDQIVPAKPTCQLLRQLPNGGGAEWRFALYPDGYHMLLRDLQGERVLGDIAAWILTPLQPLPSGHELPPRPPAALCVDG